MLKTVLFLVVTLLTAQSTVGAQPSQSTDLAEAVQRGLVTVSIVGTGNSTGDALTMSIRRTSQSSLRLRLRPGTVMKSVSGAVQDMLVNALKGEQVGNNSYRATDVVELSDDQEHIYVLEAYCLNFEKANPSSFDLFQLAAVDSKALALISSVPDSPHQLGARQAALWLSSGVGKAEIRERFPVSEAGMLLAEKAVAASQNLQGAPSGASQTSQSSGVRQLMAEPMSMFEWGMYRLEGRAERFAWSGVEVISQSARVRHDPLRNQLTLELVVYPKAKNIEAKGAKEACATFIREMKFHFGVTKESDFMREISGVATFFRSQFQEGTRLPDSVAADLEAMTSLHVQVMLSKTDVAPFREAQSCTSRLLESEITYLAAPVR